jgi:hypothetical protein
MNDLVNMLQTLALVLTVLLEITMLLWIVYAFRKLIVVFNKLMEEMERPHVHVQTTTVAATTPAESPPTILPEEPAAPVVRYPCHRCKCKLPPLPLHSLIKDGVTILVFKCGRCGKETEIDPEKSEPVQPK